MTLVMLSKNFKTCPRPDNPTSLYKNYATPSYNRRAYHHEYNVYPCKKVSVEKDLLTLKRL